MILAMLSFVLLFNMWNIHFLKPLERKRSSTWLSVDTLLLLEGEHDSLIFPVGSSFTRLWLGVWGNTKYQWLRVHGLQYTAHLICKSYKKKLGGIVLILEMTHFSLGNVKSFQVYILSVWGIWDQRFILLDFKIVLHLLQRENQVGTGVFSS